MLTSNTSYRSWSASKAKSASGTTMCCAESKVCSARNQLDNYFSSSAAPRPRRGPSTPWHLRGQPWPEPILVAYRTTCWGLGGVTPGEAGLPADPGQQGLHPADPGRSTSAADLGEYGLASHANGVGVSFGVERRSRRWSWNPTAPRDGDLAGQGGPRRRAAAIT